MDNRELIANLARRRMVELQEEMAGLNRLLGQVETRQRETPRNGKSPAARASAEERTDGARGVKRQRRRMSAAERKAVGERMRAYWAKKRKATK